MTIDPIILLEIILSAATLIITIFLAILGTIAFLGWRNLKDIEEKQKLFLVQRQKILDEAKAAIKESTEEAQEIIKSLKKERKKVRLPAEQKEQNKKTKELIEKLNNAIDSAEKRVGNLRMTNITSTPSVISSPPIVRYTPSTLFSEEEKICSNCGKTFYVSSDPTAVSHSLTKRCPYCGHMNF